MAKGKLTPRTLQLQGLWLAASKERVDIDCETEGKAIALRFQLYNAVKMIRENPALNPELAEALEVTQISLTGEHKQIVTIGVSQVSQLLEATFKRLGITSEAAATKDEVDLEAQASQERMRRMLEGGQLEEAPPVRSNPYNTRG